MITAAMLEEMDPTEEQERAWAAGAPYTPLMENMGYADRMKVKSLRGKARADDLGLVAIEHADHWPLNAWPKAIQRMTDLDVLPPREDEMSDLIEIHMEHNSAGVPRTRSAAILDAIHLVCGTDDPQPGSWFLCGMEGRTILAYDAFEGGEGYDMMYLKKSSKIFYPLRWLVREWSFETNNEPLPEKMRETICEATGGLLFAKQVHPRLQKDYETLAEWCQKPLAFGGHARTPWDQDATGKPMPDGWIENDDHWDQEAA